MSQKVSVHAEKTEPVVPVIAAGPSIHADQSQPHSYNLHRLEDVTRLCRIYAAETTRLHKHVNGDTIEDDPVELAEYTRRLYHDFENLQKQKDFLMSRTATSSSEFWDILIDREVRLPFVLGDRFKVNVTQYLMDVSQVAGMPVEIPFIFADFFETSTLPGAKSGIRVAKTVIEGLNESLLHYQEVGVFRWEEKSQYLSDFEAMLSELEQTAVALGRGMEDEPKPQVKLPDASAYIKMSAMTSSSVSARPSLMEIENNFVDEALTVTTRSPAAVVKGIRSKDEGGEGQNNQETVRKEHLYTQQLQWDGVISGTHPKIVLPLTAMETLRQVVLGEETPRPSASDGLAISPVVEDTNSVTNADASASMAAMSVGYGSDIKGAADAASGASPANPSAELQSRVVQEMEAVKEREMRERAARRQELREMVSRLDRFNPV